MKNNIKKYSIRVSIIWAASLIPFFVNVSQLRMLTKEKSGHLLHLAQKQFAHEYSKEIETAFQKADLLCKEVESAKIWILNLKEDFTALAAKFGLSKIIIQSPQNQDFSMQADVQTKMQTTKITLSCEGPLKGFVELINAAHKKYPSLYFSKMEIILNPAEINDKFNLCMTARYKKI